MLASVFKALAQMFSEPFRRVLFKSVALAIALLAVTFIALYRLLEWLSGSGMSYLETTFGSVAHGVLVVVGWFVAVGLAVGLFGGALMLMPAVTALVASFFADEIAEMVERTHYPADLPGVAPPLWRAVIEGVKTAALAVVVYLCAAPLLLFAGAGAVLFFLATAWLLGREYFELVAMRLHRVDDAKALRRIHQATVFAAGLFIAGFVSIPVLNLATPLFGTTLMVHVHKRIMDGA